jgi:3-deoxy-manno-octulosonate cytidylyltransferase (CMP-KDO synthetase)
MKALGVIPARLGSVRLPQKPLRFIAGKPLIQHVYQNVKKSRLLDDVVVATDSNEIVRLVEDFGGEAVLTSPAHASGTERVGEVAKKFKKYEIFVNIQGDEPLILGSTVDRLLRDFKKEKTALIASLYIPKTEKKEYENPNTVKVVLDKNGYALYFSRASIPFDRSGKDSWFLKHLGIYAYRRKFLLGLSKLKASMLENQEKLEQLKWLDNGFKIRMIACRADSIGVDTEEDLRHVERLLERKVKAFA